MQQRIVIVGAGATGTHLAERLAPRHEVVLVDNQPDRIVARELRGEQPVPTAEGDPTQVEADSVTLLRADGTSRLVLKSLFVPAAGCALVASANSDEVNLEVGRLGRAIGFDPVIAIQHDSSATEGYRQERITALDRTQLLASQVEQSLRHHGAVMPTGVGLGRGELVEIRLLATSPLLNLPLRELAPQRWRVAAVFRADELIVPTGETLLEVEDRVLLVGDPEVLPTVAEYLHLGLPRFPRPFGPNIVTLEREGPDEPLLREAEDLARRCSATVLLRGLPGAAGEAPEATPQEEPLVQVKGGDQPAQQAELALPDLEDAALRPLLQKHHVGVVYARPMRRTLLARLVGWHGPDARLCDRAPGPVLFARGTFPYSRILLPVSGSSLDIHASEVAIDLARQLDASLTAVNVDLPRFLSGTPEERIHEEVVPVRRLFELYSVQLDYRHHEGNPIQHLLAEAMEHDLVVLARRHGRRDTYFDPDVALRIARAAHCSALVLTVE